MATTPTGTGTTPPGTPGGGASTPDQQDVFSNSVIQDAYKEIEQLGKSAGFLSQIFTGTGQVVAESIKQLASSTFQALVEQGAIKAIAVPADAIRNLVQRIDSVGGATAAVADEIQRVTGMSVLSIQEMSKNAASAQAGVAQGAQNISSNFSKTSFEVIQQLGTAEITFANNQSAKLMALADAPTILKTFTDSLIDDVRLYKFASEGMTTELVKNVYLAKENLGLAAEDINFIFQNELSETGKITGDALKNFEKAALATVEATGMSMDKVKSDMLVIMKDFQTFGDISETRAAQLSVTLTNLGLAVSDVTSLAGKFQNFDSATQAMSNLAATTGATLDTLELFRLANEDPEMFVVSLKEQLEAQGIEFDQLNRIQQNQIASGFGIDPRVLQRLMNDNIDAITGAQYQLDARAREMTDEEAQKKLASIKSLEAAAKTSTEELAKRVTETAVAVESLAISVEKGNRSAVAMTSETVKQLGEIRDKSVERAGEDRQTLDKVIAQNNKIIEQLEEQRRIEKRLREERSGANPPGTPSTPEPAAPGVPGVSQDTPGVMKMDQTGFIGLTGGDYYAAALNPRDLVMQIMNAFPAETSRAITEGLSTMLPAALKVEHAHAVTMDPKNIIQDYLISGLAEKPRAQAPGAAPSAESAQRVEHVIKFQVVGDGSDIGDAIARAVGTRLATVGISIDGIDTKFNTNNPVVSEQV